MAKSIRGCPPILGINQQIALELLVTIDDFQPLADGASSFIARGIQSDLWLGHTERARPEPCHQGQYE